MEDRRSVFVQLHDTTLKLLRAQALGEIVFYLNGLNSTLFKSFSQSVVCG
jgi:hypothetical protein